MSGSGTSRAVRIARTCPQETKDYRKRRKQWIYGNLHHKENAKNFGSSSTLGCEKSTPRYHVTWSTFFFSKTTRASTTRVMPRSKVHWPLTPVSFRPYWSNHRPPMNFFRNSTPPINFYLKVNYLILGWDLEKRVGSAVLLP